jgi:iron complex outermembrane receptor protein
MDQLKALLLAYLFIVFMLCALPSLAQQASPDLTSKSLEDLMNMEVTSASKKEQKLSRTASAIFVITQDDIQRSGATNIPDLLHMVPGMDVAEINANTWAINARGFVEQFSNELLVMIDGRSLYSASFGGVYWDTLDLPLEDIERIEVIRGPGGAIWGGNAVNGVVNIITKKAGETPGASLTAGAGNLYQGFGTAQYGASLGKDVDYRVYAKYNNFYHQPSLSGQDGGDGWDMMRSGFRLDATLTSKDNLLFQGNLYQSNQGEPTTFLPTIVSTPQNIEVVTELGGGFLQSVWNHTYSPRSEISLQASFDRYNRADPQLPEARDTLNLEFQHHFQPGKRHDLNWGIQYFYTADSFKNTLQVVANPAQRALQIFSAFFQDEIALVPDRLYLTLGSKFEHNDYTGFHAIPDVRVAWSPGDRHMLWAAISRGVRTPARFDTNIRENLGATSVSGGIPVVTSVFGNPDFKDESLIAYEAGYRSSISPHLFLDCNIFFNSHTHLETTEPGTPFLESMPLPVHIVQPETYQNLLHGEGQGLEAFATWRATGRWTLSPGFAFERIHLHLTPPSMDTGSLLDAEHSNPYESAQLRSHLELARGISWDASAYFVDRLVGKGVPSYTRLDTGLTWHWTDSLSVSVVGQNLQRDHHVEFLDPENNVATTLVKRDAFVQFTWNFK